MDTPGATSYEQALLFYDQAIKTAPAFIWTTTETNTRADQIAAGAAWIRMQMAVNAAGVAFQPLSQALQEFPEMATHYTQAHKMLAPGGGVVQMLARIGYVSGLLPPAPREALTAKLEPVS